MCACSYTMTAPATQPLPRPFLVHVGICGAPIDGSPFRVTLVAPAPHPRLSHVLQRSTRSGRRPHYAPLFSDVRMPVGHCRWLIQAVNAAGRRVPTQASAGWRATLGYARSRARPTIAKLCAPPQEGGSGAAIETPCCSQCNEQEEGAWMYDAGGGFVAVHATVPSVADWELNVRAPYAGVCIACAGARVSDRMPTCLCRCPGMARRSQGNPRRSPFDLDPPPLGLFCTTAGRCPWKLGMRKLPAGHWLSMRHPTMTPGRGLRMPLSRVLGVTLWCYKRVTSMETTCAIAMWRLRLYSRARLVTAQRGCANPPARSPSRHYRPPLRPQRLPPAPVVVLASVVVVVLVLVLVVHVHGHGRALVPLQQRT